MEKKEGERARGGGGGDEEGGKGDHDTPSEIEELSVAVRGADRQARRRPERDKEVNMRAGKSVLVAGCLKPVLLLPRVGCNWFEHGNQKQSVLCTPWP